MEKFNWQNEHLPDTGNFNNEQSFLQDAIVRRLMDTHSWGILKASAYPSEATPLPVSATNPTPNQNPAFGEFTIVFDTDLGRLSVGVGSNPATPYSGGVAFDKNGERIYIKEDKTFTFSTDIPEGKASSGNIGIPLKVGGTSGGCDENLSEFGTYRLWVEYLEVNDPAVSKVTKAGVVTYPHIQDGYKFVLTSDSVDGETAPNGDGVSIFLAKIVWASAWPGILTLTGDDTESDGAGNSISSIPTDSATEPHRVYCLQRQQHVEILPTEADKPASYAYGERKTLADHVNAVGSGEPTVKNPHGTTLDDIPGGTTEPKASTNQKESLGKGIVDPEVTQNSPATETDKAQLTLENDPLTPANVDSTATIGTGIYLTGIPVESWVRVKNLGSYGSVYVNGIRHTKLYPTLTETSTNSSDSSPTDGWVGFSDSDAVGTWAIFGSSGKIGEEDVLFLRKVLVSAETNGVGAIPDIDATDGGIYSASPDTTPTSAGPRVLLGYVYWDQTNLYKDYIRAFSATSADNDPVDGRSAGLVGPGQISTEAKSDPDKGILSQQVVDNMIGNSDFLFDKTGSPANFPAWVISEASGFIPNSGFTQFLATTGDVSTEGPKTLSGLKVTPTPGTGTGTARIYAYTIGLKPETKYAISFWYRTVGAYTWNCPISVGINENTPGTAASRITSGSASKGTMDVFLKNDGEWHKASVIVETDDNVNPGVTYLVEFRFDSPEYTNVISSNSIYITNAQLTEGEWVVGYNKNRSIPRGSIIMWDQSSTCPPGFQLVESMSGRMPVGVYGSGSNGMESPKSALGTQITNGTAQQGTPSHTHAFTVDSAPTDSGDADGSGTSFAKRIHSHSGTTDTANAATYNLPLYTLLFCRAV